MGEGRSGAEEDGPFTSMKNRGRLARKEKFFPGANLGAATRESKKRGRVESRGRVRRDEKRTLLYKKD